MQISPLHIYNFSNTYPIQKQQSAKRYDKLSSDCVSFNGKTALNDLKKVDFSKLTEDSAGVLDVINSGTFAQILKFRFQDKTYAVKRLYPNKIIQPQADLEYTKRASLQEQLKNEISVYKRLKNVDGVPQLYLYNSSDMKNPLNNYIVTSWAEGKTSTKDGAVYDTELILPKLPQIYNTLAEFDKIGFLHGDLWAGNILFSEKRINIIDFNASKNFNSKEEYEISNLDDFKKRFLNIFLADIYHRKGENEFLKTYLYCLKLEQEFFINKLENSDNINAKNYFNEKLDKVRNLIENPLNLRNEAINTIYNSNIYWAKIMKIRKNQGDFRYYLERASKLELEHPEIIGGAK